MTITAPTLDTSALLATAEEMGALPATVHQLAALVADENYEIHQVVGVVSLDQSLVASLLRQANSAASAPTTPVTTVRDAAVRLGIGALLSMALAASVGSRMSAALPAYRLEEGALWQESVAASVAAEVVRSRAGVDLPAEAGTAALLHDLGKVVLSAHLGPLAPDRLGSATAAGGRELLETEQEVLSIDHAQVGALVAGHWGLPPSIVEAIAHHHDTDPGLPPLAAAVSLAHAMVAHVLGSGDVRGLTVPMSHRSIVRALGVDPADYPQLVSSARSRFTDLTHRYAAA